METDRAMTAEEFFKKENPYHLDQHLPKGTIEFAERFAKEATKEKEEEIFKLQKEKIEASEAYWQNEKMIAELESELKEKTEFLTDLNMRVSSGLWDLDDISEALAELIKPKE